MVSGTRRFYRPPEIEPTRLPHTYTSSMNLIRLALGILFGMAGRRQGGKAYRAAQSVVRPITPKSRNIGPEREQIPEWK